MGKIIAIGGGEIGRTGFKMETIKIDKEIIRLSGKKKPRLLFLPTASGDSSGYISVVEKYFGKKLGCDVDVLLLVGKKTKNTEIREKISKADIIYVGGGNTLKMMKTWRKTGVGKEILKAYRKGKVMAGVSAGSICWFKYGHSDSLKFYKGSNPYIKVKGLGIINALHCPHFDQEKKRQNDLKGMLKKTGLMALALDNRVALEIVDDRFRLIKSKPKAEGRMLYWKDGDYIVRKISSSNEFRDLSEILEKA